MSFAVTDCAWTQQPVADAFAQLIPRIRPFLRRAFRGFRAELREDALQEALAHCYVAFWRLFERGRQQLAAPASLARYAVAQWFDGRRVGSSLNRRDVSTPYARRRHGLQLLSLESGDELMLQAITDDRRMTVPDKAAFRVDFPGWLDQLSARNRRIALALACGDSTSQVSATFGLSPARISQLRRELQCSWTQYHGEQERRESVA